MQTLDWGHRYLMCPPDHFGVTYEINPWMSTQVPVSRSKARQQWDRLVATIEMAGASVVVMPPEEGLPDMVFSANFGTILDGRFFPAQMKHGERAREPGLASATLRRLGFEVVVDVTTHTFEGAGDALPFKDVLVAGHGQRSDIRAWSALSTQFNRDIVPVRLTDPRFYHVDLAFCPLSDRSALVAPTAMDPDSLESLKKLVPDLIYLDKEETESFAANSIVVGETVILPACSGRLRGALSERGFKVEVTDMDEFQKAGGACRCLTLALDVANLWALENH